MPWVNISKSKAIEQASKLGGRLLEGAEWDAICEEFAETVGMFKVYKDSTKIGNYWNSADSKKTMEITGKHVICGISNLAGNCWNWTNETNGKLAVIRGGSYLNLGDRSPMASRGNCNPNDNYDGVGFRIVL